MGCKECCAKIPVRSYIVLMVFLTTYINYTTRSNFSISLPAMVKLSKKEIIPECVKQDAKTNKTAVSDDTGTKYDWAQDVQGALLGGYFYGYMLGSLPGGIIAEWLGPYKSVFAATAASAVFNSLCVWVTPLHWAALFLARFVIGFAGGLVYPALQCLIGRWAPPAERGKFVSALMGNTLGTCLTWIVVGAITKSYKWPWGFHAMSLQIIVYLVIFTICTADSPENHKWITEEELNFIKTSQEGTVSKTKRMPPYKRILMSFPFWTLAILHFGNLWGLYVQITAVPKFMKEVIGFDIRFKFDILAHIIPGILMGSMGLVGCQASAALTLLVLSMSINGAAVMTNLSNPTDLAPNFAGTIFGIISFIGGITGFIVPSITGEIIKKFGNNIKAWTRVFAIGGVAYCGCGIFFLVFGSADIQPWNEKVGDEEGAGKSTENT